MTSLSIFPKTLGGAGRSWTRRAVVRGRGLTLWLLFLGIAMAQSAIRIGPIADVEVSLNQGFVDVPATLIDFSLVNPTSVRVRATAAGPALDGEANLAVSATALPNFTVRVPLRPEQFGPVAVTVVAEADALPPFTGSFSDTEVFVVEVKRLAINPLINRTIFEDGSLSQNVTLAFSPSSGANATVTASSSNEELVNTSSISITGSNALRLLTVTPLPNQSGQTVITIRANEGTQSATTSYGLFVTTVNDPPVISTVTDKTTIEDEALTFSVVLSDVDDAVEDLNFSVSTTANTIFFPENVTITGTGANRTVRIAPRADVSGVVPIRMRVTDGRNEPERFFNWTLEAVNDPPVAGSDTALRFNGSDGLYSKSTGLVPGNTPHTVEAWVRLAGSAFDFPLVLGGDGPNISQDSHFWIFSPGNNDGIAGAFGALSGGERVHIPSIPLDRWTHLAATYDGANYSVYMNGIVQGIVQPLNGFDLQGVGLALKPSAGSSIDEVRVWRRALTANEIQQSLNIPLRGDEDDLVAYWRFDEGTGRLAYDSAGMDGRSNLELTGSDVSYIPRREVAGLSFDGVDDYASIADFGAVAPTNEVTVEFWQRADSEKAQNTFSASPLVSGNRFSVNLPYSDGKVYWDFGDQRGEGRLVYTPPESLVGSWDHWALVASQTGNYMRIFRNGKLVKEKEGMTPLSPRSFDLFIGRGEVADRYFDGMVDEFRVWNVARSPEQIAENLNRSLSGTEPGLVVYYRFNETSGNVTASLGGAVFDATLLGGTAWGQPEPGIPFGTVLVNEEVATEIFLPGFDVELFRNEGNSTLHFTIDTPPSHGSLDFTGGDWASRNPVTYSPNPGYNGPDNFSYHLIDDGGATSLRASVNLLVAEFNDDPILSPIADLAILENTSTGPLSLTVTDEDHSPDDIILTVKSSDTRLVPASSVVFGGSGVNRFVTVTPVAEEIGTATIKVTATDPVFGSATISFKLRVDPKPAYALVDLGDLGIRNSSFGAAINDAAWAVGHAQSQPGDRHATLLRGLANGVGLEDLGTFGGTGTHSFANSINSENWITGGATPTAGGGHEAFLWRDGVLASLATRFTGDGVDSIGYGLNDLGDIAGSFERTAGGRRGFRLLVDSDLEILAPLSQHVTTEAFSINRDGDIVGYSSPASSAARAALWTLAGGVTNLGVLPGHYSSRALGINDSGLIVGTSITNNAQGLRRGFVRRNGSLTDLGTLPDGNSSEALAINGFGQIVGTATRQSISVAWAHLAGVNYDLNELIFDSRALLFATSNWQLQRANGISRNGTIVGTGIRNGLPRGFMAIPAWVIGKQVPRPEGAVERLPEIEIISGNPQDTPQNAFYWSTFEKRLYAIRPVTARLKWFTSFEDTLGAGTDVTSNTERVQTVGIAVWPKAPTIHVASAPVEVEPRGEPFDYGFQSILYDTTGGSARVDPTSKTFASDNTGYSVLYYLKTFGAQPAQDSQRPFFDVVRTVRWNDPAHLQIRDAVVGRTLEDPPNPMVGDPGHQDYQGKNGFVFFEKAFYDGAGPDRAHDRSTRIGSIIPVNRDTALPEDDLVVIWYRFNRIGVAWAARPVRYTLSWPANNAVDTITIASTLGSGPLPGTAFANPRVYNQPDKTLPGYNPNEEHALIAPSNGGTGPALFALRNDLNDVITPKASDPYALLKYQDPASGLWCIKVYKVVADSIEHKFEFEGVASKEIQPPYPLSILPLAAGSSGVSGPYWKDYSGRFYARAAGEEGRNANVAVRWLYPLQEGFFYDLNRDGVQDAPVGTELAWLDRRPAGQLFAPNDGIGNAGTAIEVTYNIRWPNASTLQIGETLLGAKNGLPSVKDMARVETIYDDLTPDWNPATDDAPSNGLARLYDPLSERVLALDPLEAIPASVKRQNLAGKEVFIDLPFVIRTRLNYDPLNHWLIFKGVLDESYAGEPLLLPNVLSSRERDRIKQLASGNATWEGIVDRLYDLTRNPNQVDLDKDGAPDEALRIGLTSQYSFTYKDNTEPARVLTGKTLRFLTSGEIMALPHFASAFRYTATNVIAEPLGSLPKALTAGLGGLPAAGTRPGNAVSFDGGYINGSVVNLSDGPFTIEFWAKATPGASAQVVVSHEAGLAIGFNASGQLFFEYDQNGNGLVEASSPGDAGWHHWACAYDNNTGMRAIFRDGQHVASEASGPYLGLGNSQKLRIGMDSAGARPYGGELDELRVWGVAKPAFVLSRDRAKALLGDEAGLIRYYRFDQRSDEPLGSTFPDSSESEVRGVVEGLGSVNSILSTAPAGIPPRFITLVENNDGSLGALPVTLHVIRIDDGPFAGDLKRILPDNVFDERLTMRHSSDFGGDPDQVSFEWYYKPDDQGFDPEDLPTVNPDGMIAESKSWIRYSAVTPSNGQGVNDVTIGEGGESGLFAITDNWWICRYKGYDVGLQGPEVWSDWIGDPSGVTRPRAALAEGWVKRVIIGLNPFDARVKDFHAAAVNTYSSMLIQAGRRYEGPIAFNPSADNLNSIGLIEAYTTVLLRAQSKSIDGTPRVNYNPANNALILAASRISDLYMLLGNEAYADAQDPTIGFGTSSIEYGSAASSIFAFQNQLDSPLEEELGLLRGRDNRGAGVQAAPFYNRLLWNFTLGEGEVAYQQTYNVTDQNVDGFLDEQDARIQYPQGHGDAWGHYLTAITTYYKLLRHPFFTWVPRSENVNVAGVAVSVDFLDERKFATAAAARARAGKEIVDLTYRQFYVEDPAGQWQGYKDTDRDRAWGVGEWAVRAGQGAYFDWLTANTILQAEDPDPDHAGISKIDRKTVRELAEIASQAAETQATVDKADLGYNPLGLATGVVPFDISSASINTASGKTHFEQIFERAVKGLVNGIQVFDEANRATQMLRRNQDSTSDLTRNAQSQEVGYKNRLIELYGYPYAGDIGPGKAYPSGYDGADFYKYMYIDVAEVTGERYHAASSYQAFFRPTDDGSGALTFYTGDRQASVTDPNTVETTILTVDFPVSAADYGFEATEAMGQRRAPGEIQNTLSDMVQANAQLKIALQDYDGLIADIRDGLELLIAQYQFNALSLQVMEDHKRRVSEINTHLNLAKAAELTARRIAETTRETTDTSLEALPKIVGVSSDVTSVARGVISLLGDNLGLLSSIAGDIAEQAQTGYELNKEIIGLTTDIKLETQSRDFEVVQRVKEIEAMLRDEAATRLAVYQQVEVIRQIQGRYLALLAKGARIQEELIRFRKETSGDVTEARYRDMAFRVFRNDALQKFRAQFDLTARYVYLAAAAYDYDSNFLGDDPRAGRRFLTDIVRQRSFGQVYNGQPMPGQPGLADVLGRLSENFDVIKTQFGLNNPQNETGQFSLRSELFRIGDEDRDDLNDNSDARWRTALNNRDATPGYKALRVDDLWQVPEFRRYARPFAPESFGAQPGLIIRFPSTVTFGQNFFGLPLAARDSSYDSSRFATRVRSVGVWFSDYAGHDLATTPRVYLIPVGMDILRSPTDDSFQTREWRVMEQALPTPFSIGSQSLNDPLWIPSNDSLGGAFGSIRRHSRFRAYHDSGFSEDEAIVDSRLIGRSVWNTDWMLIVPGGTFLADGNEGLDTFIQSNTDIKLFFQTQSFPGL